MDLPGPVVDARWLTAAMADHPPPELVVADVRWYPDRPRRSGFVEAHIPGAVYLDVDTDLASPVRPDGHGGRHPLPSPKAFAGAMSRAGIGDRTAVVVYDDSSGSTAARLWWMLRALGRRVAVLDGGLPAWTGPVATGEPEPSQTETFTPSPWPARAIADARIVDELRTSPDAVIVDVRAAERYRGELEPIDPVAGHIPGAVNVPWSEVVDPVSKRFLSPDQIRERYRAAGIGPGVEPVAHCGSGVVACHALLAFELAGIAPATLYVGSWSDWISDEGRPVATGPTPAGSPTAGPVGGTGTTDDGSAGR
jgi:thiosulfate/3-mercaptopyruvate sulfurtransferase